MIIDNGNLLTIQDKGLGLSHHQNVPNIQAKFLIPKPPDLDTLDQAIELAKLFEEKMNDSK